MQDTQCDFVFNTLDSTCLLPLPRTPAASIGGTNKARRLSGPAAVHYSVDRLSWYSFTQKETGEHIDRVWGKSLNCVTEGGGQK